MKIRPSYIFTVLGNAIDHIQEGYISNNIVHIPLSDKVVNKCLDASEEISSHYSIWADFSRKGLVDIYAEPNDDDSDDDDDDDNSENIDLINFDDLFEYLEFTESESLFDMICKMIYTNAPEI